MKKGLKGKTEWWKLIVQLIEHAVIRSGLTLQAVIRETAHVYITNREGDNQRRYSGIYKCSSSLHMLADYL